MAKFVALFVLFALIAFVSASRIPREEPAPQKNELNIEPLLKKAQEEFSNAYEKGKAFLQSEDTKNLIEEYKTSFEKLGERGEEAWKKLIGTLFAPPTSA